MRALCIVVFSAALFAQSTANIVGVVRDGSGGAIPGARVVATNVLTGVRQTRESTAEGNYSLSLLPVGQYRVEVEKQGFQRYVQSGVTLVVNDNANIDITLQIGSLTESVNVTAEAPLLETQTGTIRGVVDQQRIVELPLNGRQITQLLAIQAGVIQRSSGTSEGDAFVVNGSRQSGVYFLLDGGMNTDSYRNYSGVFPNPDAVQEFSIQKSNFSAEYANATGAVVSVATRSGTNQFHGSAFEFLRNGAFNARNFFAARRDSLKRSQFGGAFGGPVIRDRLFFFTSYQGTRTRSDPQLTRQFLPTAAMRVGDFSTARAITDPQTRQPFAGNQIPVSRLSPVTQALLRYIPDPGTADGQRFVGVPLKTRDDEVTAKVDANLGSHRLVGRYFFQRFERPFTGKTDDLASMFASDVGRSTQPYRNLAVNDVFTLSPRVINSATFALRWRRTLNDWSSVKLPIDFRQAGVKGIAVKDPASVYVNVSGGFLARPGWNYDKKDYDVHVSNTTTWLAGSHEIKFGGEILRSKNDIGNDFRTMGLFNFNGNITTNAFADFMLGEVYQFDQGGGEFKTLYGSRWGFFGQDNWRVNSNLTLNLGLRWDPMFPFHDDLGRTQCFVPGATSSRFPKAPAGYLNDGDPGCPTGGFNSFLGQVAPRFGFAWRAPQGGFVVRGGFGLFWNPQFTVLYNGFVNAAPFSPQITRFGVPMADPYGPAANPFPGSFAPFKPARDAEFFTPLGTFGSFASNFRPSYMETYNFTVERELTRNVVARVSYVGNLGRHLSYTDDLNFARYVAGAATGNIQQRRPYQNFGSVLMTFADSTSSYHAMQVSVERRVVNNFSFEVNYTFSKSIDEVSTDTTPQNVSQVVPLNRTMNRGLSDFDNPHRLVLSHVWSLPGLTGRNALLRAVLGNWEFSGITTLRTGFPFSVSSGADRAFAGLGSNFADLVGNPFLDNGRSRADRINQYFNTAAFAPNAIGTFGTSPRSVLRGPGSATFDLGVLKNFRITERVALQYRAELFNALNTPRFNSPFASQNTPARFGRIESAADPRILQFALKLLF